MKKCRVLIVGLGLGGKRLDKSVFATHQKFALVELLKSLPEEHDCWNWAGWRVEVYSERGTL